MPTEDDQRIGQLAVDRGWVKPAQLERALAELAERERTGLALTLGRVLYERKWIDADQMIWLVRSAGDVRAPEVAPEPSKRPPSRAPGKRDLLFGRFEVVQELARGAMGIVYKARQVDLGRIVAVKVLREGEEATQEQILRFRREAELAAKLRHPNIVPIHDVGSHEGKHFFTMEFIEGETLEARLKRSPIPVDEAVAILEKVARAIHFAHTKGIVHRDLKPANLLLDERGEPQITDFGLARRMDVKSGLTRSGAALGTPFYMAPEQICGDLERIDGRTDVFALGVILYEVLTRQRPFSANSAVEIFQQITQVEPPALTRIDPSIPRDLETICEKALEKIQERRYATAEAMAEDLARFRRGEPVLAKPVSWTDRQVRRIRRHRLVAGFAALSVVSVFAAGGLGWWHHVTSQREAASHAAALAGETRRAEDAERGRARSEHEMGEASSKAKDSEYQAAVLAATVATKEKRWEEAFRKVDEAIAMNPLRAEAFAEKGKMLRARKKVEEAIAELGKAIERAPNEPEWLYERGCAWHEKGDLAKAEADLAAAIGSSRAPARYWTERGEVRVERGNDAGAIEDFTWAIDGEPGKYDPWKRRGLCRMRRKEWDLAEKDFTEALDRYSQSAECLYARAEVRVELGKAAEAARDCSRYVKAKPDEAQGYALRGRIEVAAGDREAAVTDCEKALSIDPGCADAAWWRAEALSALGRGEDAKRAWQEFTETWPKDPRTEEARRRLSANR